MRIRQITGVVEAQHSRAVELLSSGAAYLGLTQLLPGEEFSNHYHRHHEEFFLPIEGEVSIWVNAGERIDLRPGMVAVCDPLEMHYLLNRGDRPYIGYFIKTASYADDRDEVDWRPGEPAPAAPRCTSHDQGGSHARHHPVR